MAEEKSKSKKPKNQVVGSIAVPTTLDNTTKIDVDIKNTLIDSVIDAGLSSQLDTAQLENFTSMSNSRDQVYQLIDTMCADSAVAAIIKTYAEEVCELSDNGHIVWCESTRPEVSMFVNYLLNVMNVDKYIYGWVYSLLKYGDVYLKLFRESDYEDKLFDKEKVYDAARAYGRTTLNEGVSNADETVNESVKLNTRKINDRYSYYIEMVPDPSTMFELTKYGRTYGYIETPNSDYNTSYISQYIGTAQIGNDSTNNTFMANYKMKSNDVNIWQADDYVHACLQDDHTRFPEKINLFLTDSDYNSGSNAQAYSVKRGKSIVYDAYKTWREKTLLENAILLNRITQSSVIRNIQVEVGDMPRTQAQNALKRVKELFEQKSAINTGSGMVEYNNPGAFENNVYTATHGGQGAITVTPIGGDIEVKSLGDLDEWVNKFYAAFGIPKSYFGYTEDGAGFNGGTSLAIISSVFAKGVKQVQNAMIQALTDAINLFLLNRGCNTYLNNFVLKMKAPLTQEEKDYRDDLSNRINAISNIQSLFADVEDKSRKLKILKSLIKTLNYGDEIVQEVQAEIDATEEQMRKEAEEAEKEAQNEEETPTESNETEAEEEVPDIDIPDLDLGNSSQAELKENTDINNLFITEDSDLPSPDELNKQKDFTKNE